MGQFVESEGTSSFQEMLLSVPFTVLGFGIGKNDMARQLQSKQHGCVSFLKRRRIIHVEFLNSQLIPLV